MKLTTLLIAIAAVLAIQSDLKASGPIPLKINVGGVERDALVFLPSKKTAKAPLILAFHGHGGNAKTAAHFMGLQKYLAGSNRGLSARIADENHCRFVRINAGLADFTWPKW